MSCAGTEDRAGSGSPTTSPSPSPSSSPAATCGEPAATDVELVAKNVHFDLRCLVVPAGKPVTVKLKNRDKYNHNFSIYTLEFASAFTGDLSYPGETFTYDVPALDAGQYLFQCDIHPRDMSGPLIVE